MGEGAEGRKPERYPPCGELGQQAWPDPVAAGLLIDDQRAHLGDRPAQRRQLRASNDALIRLRDNETRGVFDDVVDRARQEVADLEIVRNQPVDVGRIGYVRPSEAHHGHCCCPPKAAISAASSSAIPSSISSAVMMYGGSSRTTVSEVRFTRRPC